MPAGSGRSRRRSGGPGWRRAAATCPVSARSWRPATRCSTSGPAGRRPGQRHPGGRRTDPRRDDRVGWPTWRGRRSRSGVEAAVCAAWSRRGWPERPSRSVAARARDPARRGVNAPSRRRDVVPRTLTEAASTMRAGPAGRTRQGPARASPGSAAGPGCMATADSARCGCIVNQYFRAGEDGTGNPRASARGSRRSGRPGLDMETTTRSSRG